MSHWSDFYKSRLGDRYFKYAQERYRPLLESILEGNPQHLREEGCGIGTISKCLLRANPRLNISMTDVDDDMLILTKANLPGRNIYKLDATKDWANFVEVIFSHGVLEHFGDLQIQRIITRQRMLARRVVHYVPTSKYEKPSFGDERLLPPEYWIKTFHPKKHKLFNDNHDMILVWEV